MDWHIQFKELHVDDALEEAIRAKLNKLDEVITTEVTHPTLLVQNKSHIQNKDESIVANITLTLGGMMVRSEGRARTVREAFDVALTKCKRQLVRFKEKKQDKTAERLVTTEDNELAVLGEIRQLKRRKQLDVKKMSLSEAIERMELLDHDFYAFLDVASDKINVVYRREDGDYGTLEISAS